ncbi:unnamed protein product [Owenia fusiformis]|uniref:Uncharacterized protein n=1 Tax=Owenia fusiformis TaxID=6347 RepID=A0A8J1U1A5_OWEFU|nr:unnamed protein product [Owenia fusiformis]
MGESGAFVPFDSWKIRAICVRQCGSTNNYPDMTSQATISTSATSAMLDDVIEITAKGLQFGQHVTISAYLKEGKEKYFSYAHFTVDRTGQVAVCSGVSKGGSYEGIEPMGLFWSLSPMPGQRRGIRLMKRDVTKPYKFKLTLHQGFLTENKICAILNKAATDTSASAANIEGTEHAVLSEIWLKRWYLRPGVKRLDIKTGRIRGALFVPQGNNTHPGVIDLFGTAGGLVEYRAAILASRGFVTLALAYFAYDDLPDSMGHIDLGYFEEAVDWLFNHPNVTPGGIGVLGVSKGASIALLMASIFSKIRAVVSINSLDYTDIADIHYKDTIFKAHGPEMENLVYENNLYNFRYTYQLDAPEEALILIENSSAEFLFIHGEDDWLIYWQCGEKMAKRLRDHGKTNYRLHIYPGAGHLIEPPYSPHCYSSYHRMMNDEMLWGGKTVEHARAQDDSWKKILDFLHTQLDKQNSKL